MIPTLLALLVWIPALLGLGSFLARGLDEDLRPAVAGFAGLGVLAAAGMVANLFVPLGPWPAVASLAAGWAIFFVRRSALVPPRAARLIPAVAIVALVVAVLTQFPSAGGKGFDAGLYHLQAVRWAAERSHPRGLASLYGPLGYDVSWFVVAALLELPGLAGRSGFVLNGAAIVLASWAVLAALRRLSEGERTFGTALLATAAVPACLAIQALAFPGYDDPVTLLAFLVLGLWSLALERRDASRGPLAVAAALLAVFAVTIKLSAAALAVTSLVALVTLRRMPGRAGWWTVAAGAGTLVVGWLARGITGSGCLVFPAYQTCLTDLPWVATRANAEAVISAFQSNSRSPPLAHAGFLEPVARVFPWLAEAGRLPLLALLALALVAGLVVGRRVLRRAAGEPGPLLVAATSALGLAYWLATAPDPRYGVLYFLPLALAPTAAALAWGDTATPRRARRVLIALCAIFGLAAGGWTLRRLTWDDVAIVRWPEYPAAALERQVTANGLEVNVPVGSIQCWRAPLPCTPVLEPGLAWRGMFVVE
jgi:hypothetical protein